jgi:hypothetical protein
MITSGQNLDQLSNTQLISSTPINSEGINLIFAYSKGTESSISYTISCVFNLLSNQFIYNGDPSYYFNYIKQNNNGIPTVPLLETDSSGNMIVFTRNVINSGVYSIPIPSNVINLIFNFSYNGDTSNVGNLKVDMLLN